MKKPKTKINFKYLTTSLISFTILSTIILFFNRPGFIRYHLGDAIIIIFVYSLIMLFSKTNFKKAIIITLAIAYAVESLQCINFYALFGSNSSVSKIVWGTNFDYLDLLAYTISAGLIFITETVLYKQNYKT